MTIFVEISKLFLTKAIQEAIDQSTKKDSSFITSFFTLFNYSRDLALSKTKRDGLSELITALNNLAPAINDQLSLHNIKTLLTTYKTKLAKLAHDKQLSEGGTGKALAHALELIQSIYDELSTLKLLNISKTQDPLNYFQYYAARYFVMKIYADQRLNLIQKITEQPSFSIFRERAQVRAGLIVKALTECMKKLDRLNKTHKEYQAGRIDTVNETIKNLLEDERKLHAKYGEGRDATISLFSYLTVTQQDNELLTFCMGEAQKGFGPLTQDKPDPQADDWVNEHEERQWEEEALNKKSKEEEEHQWEEEALEHIKEEAEDGVTATEENPAPDAPNQPEAFKNSTDANDQEIDEDEEAQDDYTDDEEEEKEEEVVVTPHQSTTKSRR